MMVSNVDSGRQFAGAHAALMLADPARRTQMAQRIASTGDYVAVGAPIIRLVKTDPLRLRLDVPERQALAVRVGQKVRVSVEGASMRFVKVSGLQRQHQTATYRHGLSFIEGEQIAKYFHLSVTTGSVDAEGLRFQYFAPTPPQVLRVRTCARSQGELLEGVRAALIDKDRCPRCEAMGRDDDGNRCWYCHGTGWIEHEVKPC